MDISPEEKCTILHALGLTPANGKMPRWSYRNYYMGHTSAVESLLRKNMMIQGKTISHPCYHVTSKGIHAARVVFRVRKQDRRLGVKVK